MSHDIKHEVLAESFRAAAEREFRFLIEVHKFHIADVKPRFLRYRSSVAYVNVYHDSNFGLQVEFGLESPRPSEGARTWWSRFRGRDSCVSSSDVGSSNDPPFGLTDVLIAAGGNALLPADIEEMVSAAKSKPGEYFRWFGAETVTQVQQTMQRMAELTRKFAAELLRGDPEAFRALSVERAARSEAWHRYLWLKELPPDLASEYKDLPTDELQRRRNEYQKGRIILKEGDRVAAIRDLPADEFLKRYVSLQLKRAKDPRLT